MSWGRVRCRRLKPCDGRFGEQVCRAAGCISRGEFLISQFIGSSGEALFSGGDLVVAVFVMGMPFMGMGRSVAMVVAPWAVRMPVSAEDGKAEEVRGEAQRTDDQDELRVRDLGRFDKPGDGLEDDGDAEGDEEHRVEEGS